MEENTDYSRWQRQSLISQRSDGKIGAVVTKGRGNGPNQSRKTTTSKSSREAPIVKSLATPFKLERESACSSLCRHWPNTRKVDEQKFEKEETSLDVLQILKFQIKAKRNCIVACKKQIMNLVEENFKLKQEIENSDQGAYVDVKGQLQKYHKYRNAMGTINHEHRKLKLEAEIEYEQVRKSTEDKAERLENKLRKVEIAVHQKQTELKTLNNYKDKEYPEKIIRIGKLKTELEYLGEEQAIDASEIERVIKIENSKYKGSAMKREAELLEGIRTDYFESMNKGVKETAVQNIRFRKEIEFHKNEREKLAEENKLLERKINKLINEDRPEMQSKLFPGVFRSNEICTPDTEIVLQIPRKEFIPL